MQLTPSQADVLAALPKWFNSDNPIAILEARAGYGKTHLVRHFLDKMGRRCKPLLLAETNEAVNVLRHSAGSKYNVKTVCSAFNLVVGNVEGVKQLVQRSSPDFTDVNLLVIDEASMLPKRRLQLILDTCVSMGISVLLIGHSSQLPPVEERNDGGGCKSPAFVDEVYTSIGYAVPVKFYLTEPVRNTTEISIFCNEVEGLLTKRGVVSSQFTKPATFFPDYLKRHAESFSTGKTVALAYTNKRVAELNTVIRKGVYKEQAEEELFIKGDRLIFRQPSRCFHKPLNDMLRSMESILRERHEVFTTNTKAVVQSVSFKEVLGITCWELLVTSNHYIEGGRIGYVYYPLNRLDVVALFTKLNNFAIWETGISRQKKFDIAYSVGSVFGVDSKDEKHDLKHGYAVTVDCSQGSTIDNVIVSDGDIKQYIRNRELEIKIRYVAYSRAKNNLWRIT
jgi:hypothetical protein